MGLDNKSGSTKKFLSLKAKTSDTDPTPFIGVNEKTGDTWGITQKYNSISGKLKSIAHDSYEYQGEQKTKIIMVIEDDVEYQLEANFNSLIYSILNSLAGTKDIGKIEISVWLDPKLVDGKKYAKAALKNNGEKTEWAYKWDEIPKAAKVQVGKKTVMDDSAVIDFWKAEIDKISDRLPKGVQSNEEATSEDLANDLAASSELNKTDQLPF